MYIIRNTNGASLVVEQFQVFSRETHEHGSSLGGGGFKFIDTIMSHSLTIISYGFFGMQWDFKFSGAPLFSYITVHEAVGGTIVLNRDKFQLFPLYISFAGTSIRILDGSNRNKSIRQSETIS